MNYTVQQLASLANVSVRTLHHYDEIGLLCPARNTQNKYRAYSDTDITKLQIILLMKELGIPLEEIKQRINSRYFDVAEFLEEAKEKSQLRKSHIDSLLTDVTQQLSMSHTLQKNIQAHTDAGLDKATSTAYATEAYTRWGNTEAYKQSMERTAKYTKEDWERIKQEGNEITLRIADLMPNGTDDQEVQSAVEDYYHYMQQFYDCSHEMFRNLGQMYVDDPRFTKTYENIKPGLARFMQEAMYEFWKRRGQA